MKQRVDRTNCIVRLHPLDRRVAGTVWPPALPAGSCTIKVPLTADDAGAYVNTIPAGALQTDLGAKGDDASATLTVVADQIFTNGFEFELPWSCAVRGKRRPETSFEKHRLRTIYPVGKGGRASATSFGDRRLRSKTCARFFASHFAVSCRCQTEQDCVVLLRLDKTMRQLPETGYLRLSQIVGRPAKGSEPGSPAIIPVSRSTWWAGVKSGRYPQPVRTLGQRITAWRVDDIRALIACTDSRPEPPKGDRR